MKSKKQPGQQKPTVVKTTKYTILREHLSDGRVLEHRRNDGLNGLELLGLLFRVQQDVINQISGKIPPPTLIKRQIKKPKP